LKRFHRFGSFRPIAFSDTTLASGHETVKEKAVHQTIQSCLWKPELTWLIKGARRIQWDMLRNNAPSESQGIVTLARTLRGRVAVKLLEQAA
jgi:hypothetical protein